MIDKELRRMWNKRAEVHAAGKQCKAQARSTQLYHDSWWGYIEPLLPEIPNGRILEAGCGTGRWAEHLVPLGFDMVLSDFSPNMIAKAREYAIAKGFSNGIDFLELDVCDLHPLENDSFDMVISTGEPISLCSDPDKAISEYCRVVRPGGYVLCDAGNRYRKAYDSFRASPSAGIVDVIETGKYETANGMALHLLGPNELTSLLVENGMEISTLAGVTPFFTFPPNQKTNSALEEEEVYQAMVTIAREHAERPEIVNLSSRLLAVARKPY